MKKHNLLLLLLLLFIRTSNAQWITLNSGTNLVFQQVDFASDSEGYLLSNNNYLFKTSNGGQSWTTGQLTSFGVLYFLSSDTGFAGGNGIYKTVNGANTWNKVLAAQEQITSFSFPGNGNIGYAAGIIGNDTLTIYKTMSRGNGWTKISINDLNGLGYGVGAPEIFFTDSNTGYWIDRDGGFPGIEYTNNGGISWGVQYFDSINYGSTRSIYFPTKDTGYVVGDMILKTTDGHNWNILNQSITTDALYSVFFTSANKGFAAGGDGFGSSEIMETSDGGLTWVLDVNTTITFSSLCFPSKNLGYACGASGEILKYDEPTGIWKPISDNILSLYPNPSTSGRFHIIMDSKDEKSNDIFIYDVLGNEVYQNLKTSQSDLEIDLSNNARGVYFVKVISEGKVSIRSWCLCNLFLLLNFFNTLQETERNLVLTISNLAGSTA